MSEQSRDDRSGSGAGDADLEPGSDREPADREAGSELGDRESAGRDPGDLLVAMSPRQILGGFALLAGLLIMLKRRGRGRRSGHDRDLDQG